MNIETSIKLYLITLKLRRHEKYPVEQIKHRQNQSIKKLRNYAFANSRFYKKFHRGFEYKPLNELPVLTKSILMENFNDIITDHSVNLDLVRQFISQRDLDNPKNNAKNSLFQKRYTVTVTSGSSGQPGIFLFNKREWAWVMASFARGREWSGLKLNLLPRKKWRWLYQTVPGIALHR